jgi:hypothetical protein
MTDQLQMIDVCPNLRSLCISARVICGKSPNSCSPCLMDMMSIFNITLKVSIKP